MNVSTFTTYQELLRIKHLNFRLLLRTKLALVVTQTNQLNQLNSMSKGKPIYNRFQETINITLN